jgi:hypothetical protein
VSFESLIVVPATDCEAGPASLAEERQNIAGSMAKLTHGATFAHAQTVNFSGFAAPLDVCRLTRIGNF